MSITPTTWRTHPYHVQPWLYIDQPPIVFRALVTGTISYPVADVPYDTVTIGSYTAIKPGMLIVFESSAGADDRGRSIARRAATSSVIKMGRCSQGTQDGEVSIAAGTVISVYDHRPPWSKIPFCDTLGTLGAAMQFYKFYDFDFATYGLNQGVVVNMGGGPAWINYLDSATSVGTLSLNVITGGSYGVDGNISSILWDVIDGTITVGSTTTAGITATFPPGRRYIKCSITDTNGIVTFREMLVVVLKDGTAYVPITDFEILDGIVYPLFGGNHFSVKIWQSIPKSTYIDGATIILWEDEYFNGVKADQSGFDHIKFVGYHHTDPQAITANPNGTIKETTLECLDAIGWLDTLPGFPQEISRNSSPIAWEEAKTLNMDKYFTILARWHSTLLEITDFKSTNTGDMYGVPRLASDGDSIYQQIEKFADNGIGYHFVGDPQGRTVIMADQNLLDTAARTSSVIIACTDDDIQHIEYTYQRPPRYHWERGGAILASTTDASSTLPGTAFVIAPGPAPNIGLQDVDRAEQLVLSESELMIRTGHRKERDNANFSYIQVKPAHQGDIGVYPAKGQWVQLTTTQAAQRGITFTNQRFLPYETRVQYVKPIPQVTTKDTTWTLEKEIIGSPALDDPQPVDPNPPDPTPSTDPVPANSGNAYGSEDTYIPDGWFSFQWAGFLFLLSGGTTGGTLVPRDISPYSVYTPSAGGTHRIQCGIQDPYNYKRLIVLYDNTIAYTNDYTVAVPTWTDTGVNPPSGWQWDWRIRGSINRQNYFCWIATNVSTYEKRFYWTTDNFASVNFSVPFTGAAGNAPGSTALMQSQFGPNVAGYINDVVVGSFNTNSNGLVLFHNGSCSNPKTYISTNWGATWADTGWTTALTSSPAWCLNNGTLGIGSNIDIPYSLVGGSKNINHTLVYREYAAAGPVGGNGFTHRTFRANDNVTYLAYDEGFNSAFGMLPAANRSINSFTLDGTHATIIYWDSRTTTYRHIRITDDGGVTWNFVNTFLSSGLPYLGVNGWPTNYRFGVLFGGILQYTTDRFATLVDLSSSYVSATASIMGAHNVSAQLNSNPIVDCIPDLNAKYPVGGVHPS